MERYIEIVEALNDIPLQPPGIMHYFINTPDPGTLQRKPSRHYETDVAGAQNNYLFAGKVAVNVDKPLRHTGGEYTGRAGAGDAYTASGAFAAPHSQDYTFRLYIKRTVFRTDRRYNPV